MARRDGGVARRGAVRCGAARRGIAQRGAALSQKASEHLSLFSPLRRARYRHLRSSSPPASSFFLVRLVVGELLWVFTAGQNSLSPFSAAFALRLRLHRVSPSSFPFPPPASHHRCLVSRFPRATDRQTDRPASARIMGLTFVSRFFGDLFGSSDMCVCVLCMRATWLCARTS